MSGPGFCGDCGGVTRFWCDHCNIGKATEACGCRCDRAPRFLPIEEGIARCRAAVDAAEKAGITNSTLHMADAHYGVARAAVERRVKHGGKYQCLHCDRTWKSAARRDACQARCEKGIADDPSWLL